MSLKVILTESDIAMIVKDCTMSFLSESSEHILYHNTSVYTLAKMIGNNIAVDPKVLKTPLLWNEWRGFLVPGIGIYRETNL